MAVRSPHDAVATGAPSATGAPNATGVASATGTLAATRDASADDPTCDAARDAWEQMFRIVMGHREAFQRAAESYQLTPVQAHLLMSLDAKSAKPMNAFACRLGCDPSHVTGIVDKLEERGLIRRRASPEDRRVRLLELTPRGARVRASVLARVPPPEVLLRMSAGDLATIADLLRRARAS